MLLMWTGGTSGSNMLYLAATSWIPFEHSMQYQTGGNSLPVTTVDIVRISRVQALIDTGAERSALHSRNVSEGDLLSWDNAPLRGLGVIEYPTGAIKLQLKTAAGNKNLRNIPVLDDLLTDLVLGVDFLVDSDISILIEGGKVIAKPCVVDSPFIVLQSQLICMPEILPSSLEILTTCSTF